LLDAPGALLDAPDALLDALDALLDADVTVLSNASAAVDKAGDAAAVSVAVLAGLVVSAAIRNACTSCARTRSAASSKARAS